MKQNLTEVARLQKLAGISINENYDAIQEAEDEAVVKNALLQILDKSKVKNKVDKDRVEKLNIDVEDKEKQNEQQLIKEEPVLGTIATVITIAGLIPVVLNAVGGLVNKVKRTFALSEEEKKELEDINNKIKAAKEQKEFYDKKTGISTVFGVKPPKEGDKQDLIRYKKEKESKEKESKWFKKIEDLEKEKDEKFGSRWGNKLKELGASFHHKYIKVIDKILKGVGWLAHITGKKNNVLYTNKEKRRLLSEIIYVMIMLSAAGINLITPHAVHTIIGTLGGEVNFSSIWTGVEAMKSGKSTVEAIKIAAEQV